MPIASFLPPYGQITSNTLINNSLEHLAWFSYEREHVAKLMNSLLVITGINLWTSATRIYLEVRQCGLNLLSSLIFLCDHKSDIHYL